MVAESVFVHLRTIIPPVPESRGGLAFAVRSPWPLPTPSFLLKISALSQILGRSRLCSRGRRQPQRHPTRRELWIRPGAAYHALDEEKESWSLHLFTRFLRTREERPRRKRGGRRVTSITNLDQESGYHPCEAGSTLYGIVTRRTTGE